MPPRNAVREQLRTVIQVDVEQLLARFESDFDERLSLFSKTRKREVFDSLLFAFGANVELAQLIALTPAEIRRVTAFYEALRQLRFYVGHTEDMPGQVAQVARGYFQKLRSAGEAIITPPNAKGKRRQRAR